MLVTIPVVFGGYFETNCYLFALHMPNTMIIDPGSDAGKIIRVVEKRNLTPTAVVATHGHPDHILGIAEIIGRYRIPLWVGKGDARMFGEGSHDFHRTLAPPDIGIEIEELVGSAIKENIKPARLLIESDSLPEFGLTVWETPGHSPGGICLIGDGLAFTGDTLFAGSAGRWDLWGGNEAQLMASLKRLMTLPDNTQIYPGHGPATTVGIERAHNPYVTG